MDWLYFRPSNLKSKSFRKLSSSSVELNLFEFLPCFCLYSGFSFRDLTYQIAYFLNGKIGFAY